ncbi:MAG: translation initiation factor IF-2 [Magnetococcales bacterium]|nr:translation initiation factor IF-2 [Magnetococcales bacterium]
MSDIKKGEGEGDDEGRPRLSAPRRIVLRKTVEGGSIRQNFSHGRSKSVVVEVRKKRTFVKAGEEPAVEEGAPHADGSSGVPVEGGDSRAGASVGHRGDGQPKQILAPITLEERAQLQRQQAQREDAREQEREQERQRALSVEEAAPEAGLSPPVTTPPLVEPQPVLDEPSGDTKTPRVAITVEPPPVLEQQETVVVQDVPVVSVAAAPETVVVQAAETEEPVVSDPSSPVAVAPRSTTSFRSAASVSSVSAGVKRDFKDDRAAAVGKTTVVRSEPSASQREGGAAVPGRESSPSPRREEGSAFPRREGGAPRRTGVQPVRREGGAFKPEEGALPKREGSVESAASGRVGTTAGATAAPGFSRPAARPAATGAAAPNRGATGAAGPSRRPEKPPVAGAEVELNADGTVAAKKLTRAQREDVARKKTDALVAKRLSQLDEMRRQKQEVDEKRKLDSVVPVPARVVFKAGKTKYKGKGVLEEEEKQIPMRRGRSSGKSKFARREETQALGPVIREVIVPDMITVGELASRMAVKSSEVIKRLMAQGMMVTINQVLDQDTAVLVVEEMGHKAKQVSEGAAIDAELTDVASLASALKTRPPVVTVMGHVDHGKTSLLDAIRKSDVASREFGGITQHIGAYQVTMANGSSITFLDTPGHAAFTAMRARGAQVTDIVVLVVAADDGVMPQTIEAINHAKDAKVPIVVAINKIDKQGINLDRVTQQLADQGLVPEEWGGETIFVKVSAHTGQGIESLEEMILLQAEVLSLQADVDHRARGAIVEAKLDKGRGPVATCLVQNGTLRVGDIFVSGTEWGKIRSLIDDKGRNVTEALPAMPVEIIGFSGVPEAGDELIAVPDERRAKEIAAFRMRKSKERGQARHAPQMDDIFDQIQRVDLDEVRVIIKGDVRGSVEAVAESLGKIAHAAVRVNVIHVGVGGVNESDVMLASASDAIIVGFNVRADAKSRDLAKREQVDLRFYTVIYDLMDDITQALEGKLKPLVEETVVGRAKVRELFRISKIGLVAGCMVLDGVIQRKSKVRLLRDNSLIYTGDIHALKRFKDDAKEVREGMECGICLDKFSDIKENDVIEAFTLLEVRQTIDR